MFTGTNTVARENQTRSVERARFLCWPARTWLLVIVLVQSAVMATWLVREYYTFDYTCIIFQPNKTSETIIGPRIIYASTDKKSKRNLRTIEFNSSVPRIITDGTDGSYPMLIESDGDESAEVLVVDEPMILDSDLENINRRKRNIDENEVPPTVPQLRRRKKLRKRKKPKVESEEQMTTVESIVLIEQLPLSGVPDKENLGRIKTLRAKTTKIKHLPQSPLASGKKLRRRKKTRTNSSEKLDTELRRNPEKRYYNLEEEPTKFRKNYAEMPDSGEFISTKLRKFKGKSGTRRREGLAKAQARKPKIEPEEKEEDEESKNEKTEVPKINTTNIILPPATSVNSTNDSVKAGAISKAVEAAFKGDNNDKDKDDEEDKDKDKEKEDDKGKEKEEEKEKNNEREEKEAEVPNEETHTTPPSHEEDKKDAYPVLVVNSNSDGSLVPNKPPGFESVPRENNFKVQLKIFSALALCVARVLLDVWCCGQLVAAIPFLLGLCFTSRCLFLIRLMLDALFIVILFIYTITVIAFTAILRIFVDEMTSDVVFEWLVFGAILAFALLVYIVIFAIVLRCCELVLNEKTKNYKEKRSKSLLYTEIGSEQLLEAADDV